MNYETPSIYSFEDLNKLFKKSRSTIARWEAAGLFPKRIKLGQNSIGWRSDEVSQWLQERSNTIQETR